MTLPQASSLSPHSERRSEGDRPPPLRCTLGGDKQLDKMVHGSLSSGILSVPSLGSAEWRRREVDPPSGGIPPPLRGVSAQKCRLPEAVPPVLPQSSTKVPLWAAAQAARASGLRVTHPLAISFVRLAGSLLEAGSGLRVGRGAGRGRGRRALFRRQGPPSIFVTPSPCREGDKGQSPRLGRQGVLIGVPWPPEPMQLSEK